LPDASWLNTGGTRADSRTVEHLHRRAALRKLKRDREADDAGADDYDVTPRAHAPSLDS
jgi:hypothetical protein